MDRFWSKVNRTEGCWEWSAAIDRGGYGAFGITPHGVLKAHRVSWEIANGPIAPGMCVLHKCDNRKCVRPDHLFIGTHQDNVRDRVSKGRTKTGMGIRNREKTKCPRGHSYDLANTINATDRLGHRFRMCRECHNARRRMH